MGSLAVWMGKNLGLTSSMVLLTVKGREQRGKCHAHSSSPSCALVTPLEVSPLFRNQKDDLREETVYSRVPCHQQIRETPRSPVRLLKALEPGQ